ncbi:centrosomal protein of 76 kDa isoform X3 [Oncorhynchus tshawytscha]|uniref:Centrosomal protein of 76 kDa n=1 Tax=Oncorhynchus tshawytscha TaxID=74940 RepID=A0A8C8FPR4_ONCTS|nr:centrosomal protein of 76 kDa isoform X3 [Oncorhynchus tshawytscha]
MSLPPEKASELKQIIHNHLIKMNIHAKIRDVLAETVREDLDPGHSSLSEEDFLRALQCRGIVDDVMKDLHFSKEVPDTELGLQNTPKPATHFIDKDPTKLKKTNMDPARRYLYLQVLGGKAFLEHLQEPEPLPGQVCSTFTLYLHFRNQRFHSKPVPCACEPDLQEGFLLEIHREGLGDGSKMADATTMLSICDPVHLVLIKRDTSSETTLVSSYFLDWRTVLSSPSGKTSVAVELLGVGSECKVTAGVLNMSLDLYPPLSEILSPDIITTQDENGVNRPVCSYVRVLRAGRLLESPRQAARFVSLLGLEKAPVVGGGGAGKQEQWCSLLAFLCRNKGDCEDHATLLCSLLLGFGLDAYVCVGTKPKSLAHTWVMTRGTDSTITFWESLTAHRYLHQAIDPDAPPLAPQPRPSYPYRTIGCVFNHRSFLANCQPSDAVELCSFDFHNQSQWKAMSEEAVGSVCSPGSTTSLPPLPPLCGPSLEPSAASNQLELELRYLVVEHRKDLGLATVWDDHLSYVLSSALAAYELERCTGTSCGNEEFQDAVRRAVPDGHTFKGFPIHFLHHNARRAFATCLRSPFCDEIVCCRGDHVRLAVRVRVFAYPESACAVWVMFACKYRSVL